MQKAKLDILVAFFCYAGNGGVRMVHHTLVSWFASVYHKMVSDERIGRIGIQYPGDVPLTMERNRVVELAKKGGFDAIWMLDNDNIPDLYVGKDPGAREFWESSFDFLYERKVRGLPSVVCAPYCGPPPHPTEGGMENVYVFYFANRATGSDEHGLSLEAYTRNEAAQMVGIQPIGAGPTGCILYSTDAFDLMPVRSQPKEDILLAVKDGRMDVTTALRRLNMESYFWYEFTNQTQSQKASTEDVTNTREIALAGQLRYKQDVLFCNWDSWAGHAKPKVVGKPTVLYSNNVSSMFQEAVLSNIRSDERVVNVNFPQVDDAPVECRQDEVVEETTEGGVVVMARNVCGHPAKSVGFQTESHELDLLAQIVRSHSQARRRALRVIEVGSWVGESAIALHHGLAHGGQVFCIESFTGSQSDETWDIAQSFGTDSLREVFEFNTSGLGIKLIHGDSHAVAQSMQSQGADIVFLDAGHRKEDLLRDLKDWMPHLRSDGLLVGHDNGPRFPGVEEALVEFFLERGVDVRTYEGTTLWSVSMQDVLASLKEKSPT